MTLFMLLCAEFLVVCLGLCCLLMCVLCCCLCCVFFTILDEVMGFLILNVAYFYYYIYSKHV